MPVSDTDVKRLIAEAEAAKEQALAPYSGFIVGAAVMSGNGSIYTGCNIENPSLMMSSCAERNALIKALTEGQRDFRAIAIVSGDERYCFPCGSCRQMLFEFAPDIDIYLSSAEGVKKYRVSELLPYAFKKA